jgi:hypothetical protein
MNKISGLYTRDRFSSFAPANLADARKNVRDRLLFPVMMNSRPDPGSTSNRPPQMADAIPSAGASREARQRLTGEPVNCDLVLRVELRRRDSGKERAASCARYAGACKWCYRATDWGVGFSV